MTRLSSGTPSPFALLVLQFPSHGVRTFCAINISHADPRAHGLLDDVRLLDT